MHAKPTRTAVFAVKDVLHENLWVKSSKSNIRQGNCNTQSSVLDLRSTFDI
jgi:hypothetical protein